MSTNTNSETTETERTEAETDVEGNQEPTVNQDGTARTSEAKPVESSSTENPGATAGIEGTEAKQDAEGAADDADGRDESTEDGPPAQFQAAIQGGTIKTVLKTLRAIVDEARLHIDEDGITIQVVDPANVAMDDLELSAAAFESYDHSF